MRAIAPRFELHATEVVRLDPVGPGNAASRAMLLFERVQPVASLPGLRDLIAVRSHDGPEVAAVILAPGICECLSKSLVDADPSRPARATFCLLARIVNLHGVALQDHAQVAAREVHVLSATVCPQQERLAILRCD